MDLPQDLPILAYLVLDPMVAIAYDPTVTMNPDRDLTIPISRSPTNDFFMFLASYVYRV